MATEVGVRQVGVVVDVGGEKSISAVAVVVGRQLGLERKNIFVIIISMQARQQLIWLG